MTRFSLPLWYDLHAHFRQGEIMPALIEDHLAMGCTGILAMPNTKPPVAKVHESDPGDDWSIEGYLAMLKDAGADRFSDVIVPLYLTRNTTPAMIDKGAESGLLRACKYYPPHGTTGAEFGCPFTDLLAGDVLKALEANGVVLCVHGEEHDISDEDYFARHSNAEDVFYAEQMPRAVDRHPALKIVAEHVTTAKAVDFVTRADNVAATITPQHLIYTVGHLVRGLKYHLYCLPLVKFEDDRAALRAAATAPDNTRFFAGTDSAPHTEKATPCGCAAGCYTGAIAPQLYAEAFELAGCSLDELEGQDIFKRFLCLNGPAFYGLPVPDESFTLSRAAQTVSKRITGAGDVVPLPLGMSSNDPDAAVTIPWQIAA